jgi:hypothetical protein
MQLDLASHADELACRGMLRQEMSLHSGLTVFKPGVLQHEKFQSAPGSRVGTPAYLAPEVIMTTKGQTYDGKVGSVVPASMLLLCVSAVSWLIRC